MRSKQTLKYPNVGNMATTWQMQHGTNDRFNDLFYYKIQHNMGVCCSFDWQINAIDTNKYKVIPTSEVSDDGQAG